MRTIWGLDGTNRVHMLWHACGSRQRAAEQFAREVEQFRERFAPALLVVAFDAGGSFRRRLCAEYKAHRPPRDPDLDGALEDAVTAMIDANVPVLSADGFEADDCLATLALQVVKAGDRCVLVSPDKDLRQCLRDGLVTIRRLWGEPRPGTADTPWLTARQLQREFGFGPDRWCDYQCVVGDRSDGITGARGIGPKLAAQWLARASLDEILANQWLLATMTHARWRSLQELARRLVVVRALVTLRTDVPSVADCLDPMRV